MNSDVFKKLEQIENLLDLKKKATTAKGNVEDFLRDVLEPLSDESRQAGFDLSLPVDEFTCLFDARIAAIDQRLLEIAA